MSCSEEDYRNLERINKELTYNYELLSNIIQRDTEGKLFSDLEKIEQIIKKDIPEKLRTNAPPDFYDLYTEFLAEYERFKDFILYDKLIGKNIIALGGGFSSGKSSFLNALMGKAGKPILPEAIKASTSVPTYIVSAAEDGPGHEVSGINIFDAVVKMQPRDITKISHGFGEVKDTGDVKLTKPVQLGHVLNNMFFSTKFHKYEHIAFLDTPGYSKPDTENYSERTDENIARGQLNSSNYILWFIQADCGTAYKDDIKFIQSLKADIPKLIILNKADKKSTLKELKNIKESIRAALTNGFIEYIDVLAFTNDTNKIHDPDLKKHVQDDMQKILAQISEWDKGKYKSEFARNFKKLFLRCGEYYEKKSGEEAEKMHQLNYIKTYLINSDGVEEDEKKKMVDMLNEMFANTRKLKEDYDNRKKSLKELQTEFSKEIGHISDMVGIDMPDLSYVEYYKDKMHDPLKILEQYKKQNGIKTDPSVSKMLTVIFDGIDPVLNRMAGGSEYKAELEGVITKACDISPRAIHIFDVIKSGEYAEIMKEILG